jgi:hypothetical protein
MKSFIAPAYTFTPGGSGVGTVNLSGISNFNIKFLVSIINQTDGEIIYSTASADLRYTNVVGTTVTLFKDTSGMSGSDTLQVIYEDLSAIQVSQPDLFITGAAAQTAVVNNIIPVISGTDATDVSGYRSASIQVVSTGTAGTFIFEQSNNNVNFVPMGVYNSALATGVTIVAAITASASQIVYSFPIRARYIRLRIATTITGGSIQAFSRFSQESWSPAVMTVAQSQSGNLAMTANIASAQTLATVTTVGTVTAANLAIPGIIADVASAALTTTTTTATLTPTFGTAYQVNIPVTVVSGTNPTLDVSIEESTDTGTNWIKVYDFPRITATGQYNSPILRARGNRIRYVQTVGGTTPSFTRSVNRLQISHAASRITQIIDRTIVPNTLNSVTPSLFVEGCQDFNYLVRCSAQTTPATLTLQFSHDGSNWHTTSNTLTTVVGIAHGKVQNEMWKFARLIVTAAGTGITLGEAMIVGNGQ